MSKRIFMLVFFEAASVQDREVDCTDGNGKFASLFRSYESTVKSLYLSTAENLKQFQEIGELPLILMTQVEKYQTAMELAAAFIENQTAFHKTCMTSMINTILNGK